MGPIGMAAVDVGVNAANAGLGLLLQKHNDRRQLKQQGKLLEQQYGINKRQMAYGKELDLQMWKDTNYGAQVEELKKAGLNPGLLYGQSGGGGSTTGGSGGGVSAAGAPQGGGEIMGMMMMKAQKDLIEAQTLKTKEEAANIAGVERTLKGAQGTLAENIAQMYKDTYEATYSRIKAEADKAEQDWRKARAEGDVAEGTVGTQIATKEAELLGIGIANELRKAQTGLTEEQAKATAQSVMQKWQEVEVAKDRLKLEQFVRDVSESTRLTVETVSRLVGDLTRVKIGGKGETPIKNERGWSEKSGEWWKTTEGKID